MGSVDQIQQLTAEAFSPFTETEFELSTGADAPVLATLVLSDVSISKWAGADGRHGFALLFTGPAQPALPQSTFRLRHSSMGDLDIFLVPISGDSQKREYQAVFN